MKNARYSFVSADFRDILSKKTPEASLLPVSELLTRLELVTSSLPRMRTTTCAIAASRIPIIA